MKVRSLKFVLPLDFFHADVPLSQRQCGMSHDVGNGWVGGMWPPLLYSGWLQWNCIPVFKHVSESCWGIGFSCEYKNVCSHFLFRKFTNSGTVIYFHLFLLIWKGKISLSIHENAVHQNPIFVYRGFSPEWKGSEKDNAASFKYIIHNLLQVYIWK